MLLYKSAFLYSDVSYVVLIGSSVHISHLTNIDLCQFPFVLVTLHHIYNLVYMGLGLQPTRIEQPPDGLHRAEVRIDNIDMVQGAGPLSTL